jgi:hypothetical protein
MIHQMGKKVHSALFLLLLAILLPVAAWCQTPVLKTTITKNQILIGEQLQLKVKAEVSLNAYTVDWFVLPDSPGHFEVVDPGKLDTSGSGNSTVLQQTITLTSFDSGSWTTPPFAVAFKPISGSPSTTLYADSMPVMVAFAVDTSMQLKDIKPIFEVQDKWPLWYYLAGAGIVLFLALLSVFLYRYFSRKKSNGGVDGNLSPYNEAMQQLEKLRLPDAADAESVKLFYTRLAEIVKQYVSRTGRVNVKGNTTGELLLYVAGRYPGNELKTMLASLLRCSDAVKFARFLPAAVENSSSLEDAKKCIATIEQTQNRQQ